jgi:hypothetical protein
LRPRRGRDHTISDVRNHANFVAAVSAGLLVIGFGMIAGVQAATSGKAGIGNGWMVAGICVAALGALAVVAAVLMYVWLPKVQRQEHADRRRQELRTGEKLESGRSIYSDSGRHRLHMHTDGNVIEWADGWIVLWKTDTEHTGAKYLTLLPGGKLVVCKGDGTEVKVIPGTDGRGGTRLRLQDDAQLVLLRDDDTTAWRTARAVGVTWG